MTPIRLLLAAAALSLAAPATAGPTVFASERGIGASAAHPHPGPDYTGRYYTTPGGCSYSRAQVPGYHPTWHLVLNGGGYGLTDAGRRCPVMLGDYRRM
ncbi:hypothetical protein [Salipiger mucosus]|uniref:Uncharacterized protein n=1 Tax=Salipiger mucosus DSM 16094 TaxID=1123237 RepID=S9QZN6_9RHOB|nr:hypothetical protein [Salipiger mucosus]EPX85128.1 hypothetical protein Salmuc_01084 [Salipiger mucosus DSM 16094]